ncbi:MAG: glycerophosphodiester phosphodiesterase family protein, partial [Chloroflexota bacterium]
MMSSNHARTPDEHFHTLNRTHESQADYDLAIKYAPRIRFDRVEPFWPSVVGYTVFRKSTKSLSFPRNIELDESVEAVIEYATWWDWDIQHLYELEHIWVYVDADGNIVRTDASWHGGWNQMQTADSEIPLENGRVTLFSEPGKHAFAATTTTLLERRPVTDASAGENAGKMAVHVTPLFEGVILDRTPTNNRVVRTYLERLRFTPTYEFTSVFDLRDAVFVPWNTLQEWIPERVNVWVEHLKRQIPENQRHVMRIAHRGASAHAREGSTSSIQKAKELGADVVEIDIRLTRDNVPIVFHDAGLQRVFGINRLVSELDADELASITPPDKEPILTFAEMVKLCQKHALGLYLDIKEVNAEGIKALFDTLEQRGMFKYAIFSSFRPDIIAEIKGNRPDAITSILFSS